MQNIPYTVRPNAFMSDTGQCRAIVQSHSTVSQDDIIKRMLAYGSNLNEADSLAAVKNYLMAMGSFVVEGHNVCTPYLNCKPTIKGNFEDETDSFDANRHQIEISITAGVEFHKVMKQAHVQKQEPVELQPRPLAYYDIVTGQRNSLLTPGGMGRLTGHRQKFNSTDPNQGIFFIDANANTFRVEVIGKNAPSELMFMIPPNLIPGTYRLEVRSQLTTSDLRIGVLKAVLTVS